MTNTTKEFLTAMTLLRQGARCNTEEYVIASGGYQAKLKKWQIKLINSTIIVGMIGLISLITYSFI
jgi:predicted ATP-grasp superfamily ATP-dependent carboligase